MIINLNHDVFVKVFASVTVYLVLSNIVFFIPSATGRFIDCLANFWTISFQDDWSVAKGDCFFRSYLFVFNETAFDKIFFTVLFLLWFEVGGVCSVTFFTVAMFASNNIVVFSFFYHHNFIDTSFASGSDGSNVKSNLIVLSSS